VLRITDEGITANSNYRSLLFYHTILLIRARRQKAIIYLTQRTQRLTRRSTKKIIKNLCGLCVLPWCPLC
jgi:hypothetical protein